MTQKYLDAWSEIKTIRRLVQAGFDTYIDIAKAIAILWPSASPRGSRYIQSRVCVARMPKFVRREYKHFCMNRTSTQIRWAHAVRLFHLFNAEYNMYPKGNGPCFQAAWADCLAGRLLGDSK